MEKLSYSAYQISFIGYSKFLKLFFFFFGVQLLYNVVLFSAGWQSESAVRILIPTPFWISLPFRSPQSTVWSALCYATGSR